MFNEPDAPKFTYIDLFCGIGGFRLAFRELGGHCVFSSEIDKYACETYKTNFGETPDGDIKLEETKAKIPDNFDILCAGFPCQPFSVQGKRLGVKDPRGTLFFEIAEILRIKRPKAFLLENVPGLRSIDNGQTFKTMLHILREELGYIVPEPEILNSADFNVPQRRKRIFIVGFRPDLNLNPFKYPEPEPLTLSVKDILETEPVDNVYYWTEYRIRRFKEIREHNDKQPNRIGFGYKIIDLNSIANTLCRGGDSLYRNIVCDPRTQVSDIMNKNGLRKFTPRECARLQGFPDTFMPHPKKTHAWEQFGNSVSVPVIRKIGEQMLHSLKITELTDDL